MSKFLFPLILLPLFAACGSDTPEAPKPLDKEVPVAGFEPAPIQEAKLPDPINRAKLGFVRDHYSLTDAQVAELEASAAQNPEHIDQVLHYAWQSAVGQQVFQQTATTDLFGQLREMYEWFALMQSARRLIEPHWDTIRGTIGNLPIDQILFENANQNVTGLLAGLLNRQGSATTNQSPQLDPSPLLTELLNAWMARQ